MKINTLHLPAIVFTFGKIFILALDVADSFLLNHNGKEFDLKVKNHMGHAHVIFINNCDPEIAIYPLLCRIQ